MTPKPPWWKPIHAETPRERAAKLVQAGEGCPEVEPTYIIEVFGEPIPVAEGYDADECIERVRRAVAAWIENNVKEPTP